MNLLTLLQATATVAQMVGDQTQDIAQESYFSLILKGGWILLPILLLSLLSIYIIINKWITLNRVGKKDTIWLSRVMELVVEGKIDKALKFCVERPYASAQVIAAGLKDIQLSESEIEESMQLEARIQITKMESQMNYLGITASIAPMLGFLGTILGIIKIFYEIATKNSFTIDTMSSGLYQKMICSAAGLFVGIVAYTGYYILNGRIDKMVVHIEKDSNEILKAIRNYKRSMETA